MSFCLLLLKHMGWSRSPGCPFSSPGYRPWPTHPRPLSFYALPGFIIPQITKTQEDGGRGLKRTFEMTTCS